MREQVPEVVVLRLPLYLRTLSLLEKEGRQVINSQELGSGLKLTSSQVRKDLSFFGRFGKRGKGYNVKLLKEKFSQLLNADRQWKVILVGVGKLGQEILDLKSLPQNGFKIIAAFDKNPHIIGRIIGGVAVKSVEELEEIVKKEEIRIAIMAVPATEAQKVAERLISSGIKAILNYAPYTLEVPPGVKERTLNLVAALQSMTYYL